MEIVERCVLKLSLLVVILCTREALTAKLYGLQYDPNDFIVAQPTCVHRLPLTQASRHWRGKGIRSFTVLNNTELVNELNNDPASKRHLETYAYWEDDSIAKGTWRGANVGDTRAAVTPFMAHKHFGETYKWMLYGDDDSIFYMTGVLKLLSQFDPDLPLAITDNVWYMAAHPNAAAPRCLPCGFNLSTIKPTNHSFVPRPACPFCTRALACGTYGPAYRCNDTHLRDLRSRYGPDMLSFPSSSSSSFSSASSSASSSSSSFSASGGSRVSDERKEEDGKEEGVVEGYRAALRKTQREYVGWMAEHLRIKSRYPAEMRTMPALDWEMRDPDPDQDHQDAGGDPDDAVRRRSRSGSGSGGEGQVEDPDPAAFAHVADASYEERRRGRRRRRTGRRHLLGRTEEGQEGHLEDNDGDVGDVGEETSEIDRDMKAAAETARLAAAAADDGDGDGEVPVPLPGWRRRRRDDGDGDDDGGGDGRRRRRRSRSLLSGAAQQLPPKRTGSGSQQSQRRTDRVGRHRPTVQEYVDGTPWLSAVLGRQVSHGDPEWQRLRLPYPFCARHDESLHARPAPSCLFSISGHGGTGIIFSRGLMSMIDPRDAIRFISRQTGCGGGDCLLGRVLWFRMGIGFTDPGTALQYGSERYDKFTRFIDSNFQMTQIMTLADPPAVLLNRRRSAKAPFCDASCVWLIENVVGTHVRAANRQVNSTVVEMLKRIRGHALAYRWVLEARRDPQVLAGRTTIVRAVKARHGNTTTTTTTTRSSSGGRSSEGRSGGTARP